MISKNYENKCNLEKYFLRITTFYELQLFTNYKFVVSSVFQNSNLGIKIIVFSMSYKLYQQNKHIIHENSTIAINS